jgi:type I restriction enzyme M protein
MVALPGQLFYSTQIPVCLWFLTRDKSGRAGSPSKPTQRGRQGSTLFIDARKLGTMIDRVHRNLTEADIQRIAGTYHAWRGEGRAGSPLPAERRARSDTPYQDIPGFCKSAKLEEIRTHGHVLTPGRYVGAEEAEDDGEPFGQKMKRLTTRLEEQFAESAKLEKAIRANLKGLGLSRGRT